jgi:glycosyltransferase involved in cell wall biosynthesis
MPFLTIAVPTYNRLRWISLTLPVIVEQAKEFPEGAIEIVISDNCSTDETWTYLQEMASRVSFFRLNRNEKNIGSEANFYLLPQLATGRYLWMIGDDDLLKPDALRKVMSALQDEPGYLIVNSDVYDARLKECMRANSLNADKDEEFATREACLARIDALAMSFLSMWVGRREFFNAISAEKHLYFSQWGMSIQADRYFGIERFPKGKLLAAICLSTRQNTEFKDEDYFGWFLHGSAEVFRYAGEMGILSKTEIQKRKDTLLKRDGLRRVRYERRKGIFKRSKTYAMLRADYGDLTSFWVLGVPTMFAPGLGTALTVVRRLFGRKD